MDNENLTSRLESELERLTQELFMLAKNADNDSMTLVTILKHIESLHRKIREDFLEPSLPNTRHHLYLLLKHIDDAGGWPYIERMKLKNVCKNYLNTSENQSQE